MKYIRKFRMIETKHYYQGDVTKYEVEGLNIFGFWENYFTTTNLQEATIEFNSLVLAFSDDGKPKVTKCVELA